MLQYEQQLWQQLYQRRPAPTSLRQLFAGDTLPDRFVTGVLESLPDGALFKHEYPGIVKTSVETLGKITAKKEKYSPTLPVEDLDLTPEYDPDSSFSPVPSQQTMTPPVDFTDDGGLDMDD
ncbi:unnamed protein product, partial [Mesorhabditis spiculigera]